MMTKSLRSKTVAGFAAMLCAVSCADDTTGVTGFGGPIAADSEGTATTGTATSSGTDTPPGLTTITATAGATGTTTTDPQTDSTGRDTDPSGVDTSTGPDPSTGPGESSSETTAVNTCGDDTIDGSDVCDGTDLGGADCMSEGFDGGSLACDADCSAFDTSACMNDECGDAEINGTEVCDGDLLGGSDCLSEGFDSGTLACAANCMAFDTTACDACGDAALSGPEVCDGALLGGADCVSEGFDGGTLGCAVGCLAFDTSGCYACGDAAITAPEVCDGDALGSGTCVSEGFDSGTLSCAADCLSYDTSSCIVCGDDVAEGTEVCDGTDVPGTDCITEGFESGTLGCLANCSEIDTSTCVPFECGDDITNGAETCDGTDLGGETCDSQGFGVVGTLACAGNCLAYDVSGCALGACVDEVIGSPLGVAAATGDTTGDDASGAPISCGSGTAADHVMEFTAPVAGTYMFTTHGSGLADTVLALYSDCDTEIACDDDSGIGLHSAVSQTLAAGEMVFVLVKGWGATAGAWQLNVGFAGIAGPGLAQAVPDDGYDGTLASMACNDFVLGTGGTSVEDVEVELGIASTYIGDLTVKVVSPTGTVITPLSRPGLAEAADDGADGTFGDSSDTTATSVVRFADLGGNDAELMGGALSAAQAVCLVDGVCDFAPNPGAAAAGTFGSLAGETPQGTWRVCVGDSAADDPITVDSVRLNVLSGP